MAEYKVLTDNSALRRRLEHDDGSSALDLIGVLGSGREPDAGERRMMSDMGLTESELFSGLAGMSVDEWVIAAAKENGVDDPLSSPAVVRHMVRLKQMNADAHCVSFEEYDAGATAMVRSRMKVLWGSGMSGAEYVKRKTDSTVMDWSSAIDSASKSPFARSGKTLAPNAPSDDIFTLSADNDADGGYAAYKEEKRRERMKLLENLPDMDDVLDDSEDA